jgi:hypothetical protein
MGIESETKADIGDVAKKHFDQEHVDNIHELLTQIRKTNVCNHFKRSFKRNGYNDAYST